MQSQRKGLKRTMSGVSGRRRRKETMVSIRKARKEDGYAQRRNMAAAAKADKQAQRSELMKNLSQRSHSLLVGIERSDLSTQIKSCRAFVLLMTSGVPPLFDDSDPQHVDLWNTILSAVPYFVKFLDIEDQNQLRSDSCFALRFIASMDRSQYVINAGALPKLTKLLHSGISELQIQAAWCLGNIASETEEYCLETIKHCNPLTVLPHIRMSTTALRRATVWLLRSLLDCPSNLATAGVLTPELVNNTISILTQLLKQLVGAAVSSSAELISKPPIIAPWRMFEFDTGKPAPNNIAVVRFLRTIDNETVEVSDVDINFDTGSNETYVAKISQLRPLESLEEEEEEEEEQLDETALTICDSCWILVELSSAHSSVIQNIIDTDICSSIVKLLGCYKSQVVCSPILRLFGNVVSGTEQQAQVSISCGLLSFLPTVLLGTSRTNREEVCWMLSNLAAGTPEQIKALLNEPNLVQQLVEQLRWAEWDVRREAAWAICNLLIRSDMVTVSSILQLEVLPAFEVFLEEKDPQSCLLVLEAMENILRRSSESNTDVRSRIMISLEESGCVDRFDSLCYDENDMISKAASHIMDTYFQDDQGDRDMSLQPSITHNESTATSMFSFQPPEASKNMQFDFSSSK